jgi:outer membrane protein
MRKLTIAAATAVAITSFHPAHAGNPDGHWQVKLLATTVRPDGKISSVKSDPLHLVSNAQVTANNNDIVPTIAVEYFLTKHVSIETICCLTSHHVGGTAGKIGGVAVDGARLVDHVMILPATLTLKYHLTLPGGIKPYVGVGPALYFVIDEKPGSAAASALGITRVKMSNELGVALQAGIDVPINHRGLGLTIDAKKYFISTNAHFYVGSTEALVTRHKLDPWLFSAGLAYRF